MKNIFLFLFLFLSLGFGMGTDAIMEANDVEYYHIIGLCMTLLAIFITFYSNYNKKLIEQEKSRLKKIEILFNMRVDAIKAFNEIYQKTYEHNLNNYNGIDGRIRQLREIGIRDLINDFRIKYEYLFETKELKNKIDEVQKAIGELETQQSQANDTICDNNHYKKITILIGEVNEIINNCLFSELKIKHFWQK